MNDSSVTDPPTYPKRSEVWAAGHGQREIAEGNGELFTALLAYRDRLVEDLRNSTELEPVSSVATMKARVRFYAAVDQSVQRRAAEREAQS